MTEPPVPRPQDAPQDLRRQLMSDQVDLIERLTALRQDFDAMVAASAGSNADDEHDPEGSTIAYERSQLSALTGQALRHLHEVEAALARWDAGGYGLCEGCGEAIGDDRLTARPAARLCIGCARRHGG